MYKRIYIIRENIFHSLLQDNLKIYINTNTTYVIQYAQICTVFTVKYMYAYCDNMPTINMTQYFFMNIYTETLSYERTSGPVIDWQKTTQ